MPVFDHWLSWLQRALSGRGAHWLAIGLGTALACTSLGLGLTLDDHFHLVAVRDHLREPWDLFAATQSKAKTHDLIEQGIFPWWTDPELRLTFFRPISSLSLWLDYSVWPNTPALMHLHSVLWFVLLLLAAHAAYAALYGENRRTANLALLLYAIDDARVTPIGWIANRNALTALAFGFLALALHHRWRAERQRGAGWLAPFAFALSLLSGEIGVQSGAYLFAYALCLDRARWPSRLLSLAPYALVVVAWRLVYDSLDHGARYAGVYIDIARDPARFAQLMPPRFIVLLLSQYAEPFSDLWEVYPLLSAWLQPAVIALSALVLPALFALFRPLWRRDPLVAFWALGSALAIIPACSTFPEDRLLTGPSLGAAALLSTFFGSVADNTYPRAGRWITRAAMTLAVVHLCLAPVLLVLRLQGIDVITHVLERSDSSIVRGAEASRTTTVIINAPAAIVPAYFPWFRRARREALPEHFRWLATGEVPVRVERVDAHTLKVAPQGGYLIDTSQRMFRRVERSPKVGSAVKLKDTHLEITRATPDGRPAEVAVRFAAPLDDPRFQWLQWGTHEYVPFKVPEVGKGVTLPAVDVVGIAQ